MFAPFLVIFPKKGSTKKINKSKAKYFKIEKIATFALKKKKLIYITSVNVIYFNTVIHFIQPLFAI